MEKWGHLSGCGAPKGTQAQPWLHTGGQLPSPRALGPTSTNRTDRGRCILGASGAFPDASASPEAAGGATALQPLPLTPALPRATSAATAGVGCRGRLGLTPSVAPGALWLPRSQPHPAQEQSAKHPRASVPATSVRACRLPARVQVLPLQS